MKKRIYGLETEYGVAFILGNGIWLCGDIDIQPFFTHLSWLGTDKLHFLANGSRLYVDMSAHPEYCTAECLSLRDLVAHDKAGEKMLDKISNEYTKHEVGRIHLFKNNVQHFEGPEHDNGTPVTFGCHENFLIAQSLTESALETVLVPFLVVRQIVTGSGWVANRNFQDQNIKYAISQRSKFIGQKTGAITHGSSPRAILCTARLAGEPHADSQKYKRLHLLVGDSNMSELSTFLKMASTSILLEMMEENYHFMVRVASLMPQDPVNALHLVSQDLTCKKPVIELADGRNFSAIDLFLAYIELMEEYERTQGLDQELSNALKILIDILQRFEKREIDQETLMEINSQGLDEELDWLIKKSILEDSLKRFGCAWDNFTEKMMCSEGREVSAYDQIRAKDKKYHDISKEGLYNEYVASTDLSVNEMRAMQIRTPRIVERAEIEYMEENPPQNTRAKIRGDFIRFLVAENLIGRFYIDWGAIHSFTGLPAIFLQDPFATKSDELDKLRRSLQ